MVDVLKSLGFEYIASNPGSSFRSLQESFVNYGGNKNPEWLTCCHEESSIAMAHGYAEVEGKPMLTLAHSTVGLQHASMGIYNAYAGRVPVFVLGNTLDAAERSGSGVVPQRAGRGGDGARFHQVGRLSDFADAFRRVRGASLQDIHDAAEDAGGAGGGQRTARKSDQSKR
jgi:hypothetical protein